MHHRGNHNYPSISKRCRSRGKICETLRLAAGPRAAAPQKAEEAQSPGQQDKSSGLRHGRKGQIHIRAIKAEGTNDAGSHDCPGTGSAAPGVRGQAGNNVYHPHLRPRFTGILRLKKGPNTLLVASKPPRPRPMWWFSVAVVRPDGSIMTDLLYK